MGPDVRSLKGAWEVWDRIALDERIGFAREPDDLDGTFRKHSRSVTISPKVWADAYLLAFAETANLTLVTFDRALARRSSRSIFITDRVARG
jgi:predicted nucleic acid-binding protein